MSDVDAGAATQKVVSVGPYELWMLAQGAVGAVGVGGLLFLIPAFVLDQGGSPGDAGAVMAVVGGLALAGPFVGSMADRFMIHRWVQLLGIVLLAGGAISFAFAEQILLWWVAAVLVGLGLACLIVVNATFVVGAGFDEETQASKLALLQMSTPAGQVVGLALIALLTAAEVEFRGRFLFMAALAVVFLLVVAAVNGPAASRIVIEERPDQAADEAGEEEKLSLRAILFSQFGVVLLLAWLIMTSSQAIETQYPNYMKGAFDIDPENSAAALAVIVLLSVPLYPVAGRWTARFGPRTPYLFSAAARAAAGLGLLLLPKDAGLAALIVFGVVMLVFPMFELNAATLAASTSPIGPGGGQGGVGAAFALGTVTASVLAGWVADQIGFESLAAITMGAAAAALVIGLLFLKSPGSSASVDDSTVDEASPAPTA